MLWLGLIEGGIAMTEGIIITAIICATIVVLAIINAIGGNK